MPNAYLYNKIKNPLNNDTIINQMIEAYASPSFSKALLKINSSSSEVISDQIEVEKLYVKLFNTWKYSILALKPEEIKTGILRGTYDKSIYKLYSLLKSTPDATTIKDVNIMFTREYKDPELVKALSKYRWDSESTFTETIINARSIYAKKFLSQIPEHELYINSANYDLHRFANIFIEKCRAIYLPYYFKISDGDNCDNKITIYSDSKNLSKYISVLSSIEKEHPEIIRRCGEPPIISGKITRWLGYGKTSISSTGELEYLQKRIQLIEASIDQELRIWYKENKDQISIKGKHKQTKTLTEYLSLQICRDEISKMIKCLPKADFEKPFNMANYGYTEETLTSQEFGQKFYSRITEKMNQIIEEYSNGRPISTDITITFDNGKVHKISPTRIMDEIKKSIKIISSVDSSFAGKVKARIIENSTKAGIDPNNYCFTKQNLQTKSINKKEIVLEQLASIKELASQYGCQYPREQQANETIEQYSMYLKLYCTKVLKPVMDIKNQEMTSTAKSEEPKHKPEEKKVKDINYRTMTPEEIKKSQEKLGFINPTITGKRNNEHNNFSNNTTTYSSMTYEEIASSRQKIGAYSPQKRKIK